MFNLLISCENVQEHYYSQSDKGILVRKRDNYGLWSDAELVADNSKGVFWVYSDSSKSRNMIYFDRNGTLVYAQKKDGVWNPFPVSRLNEEITPLAINLYSVSGRLNLIYSAKYGNEYILVHCILGNNAMPQIINKLSSPHFWIFDNKVYYTNPAGLPGYTHLSDEKPEGFHQINDFGNNVVIYSINENDVVLFTHENRLYINGREILYDSRMESPTLCSSAEKLYAMWKSGGYIRYITSDNYGKNWTSPMRFMTSGGEIQLYHSQVSDNSRMYYGYNTTHELHLFGKPDLM